MQSTPNQQDMQDLNIRNNGIKMKAINKKAKKMKKIKVSYKSPMSEVEKGIIIR